MGILGPRVKASPFAVKESKAKAAPPAPSMPLPSTLPIGGNPLGHTITPWSADWLQLADISQRQGSPYTATIDGVRGDWLYVATDSTLPLRADISSSASLSDSGAVQLTPGLVIAHPFDKLKLYLYAPTNAYPLVSDINYTPLPVLRLFYGTGPCPFQTGAEARGATLLGYTSLSAGTFGNISAYFRVNEGMRLSATMAVYKNIGAGLTSDFWAVGTWFNSAGTLNCGTVAPSATHGSGFGAISTAYARAAVGVSLWNGVIVPRGAALLQLVTQDYGNDNVNSFGWLAAGFPTVTVS